MKKKASANPPVKTEKPQKQHSDYIYLFVAFCEGAAVIAVELLGAKMLSPYYGTSLIVWTAVIGITIGFLTLGYFTGGLLATKNYLLRIISYALALASLFIVIMPVWSRQLFLLAQNMSLYTGCTLVAALLLGPPLLCLGTTSPLIIQQLTKQVQQSGKNAGRVYAISTIGGILFTFLFGFFIIPEFGISKPMMVLSIALLAISIFLYFELKQIPVIVIVISVFVFSLVGNPAGKKSGYYSLLYESEGIMGQLKVLEYTDPGSDELHHYMLINGIAHTNMIYSAKLNMGYSNWDYVHEVAMVASLKRDCKNALILGFGGGNIATEFQHLNMKVDAVDLDGRVLDVAKNYFYYTDSSLTFIVDDARHYVRTTKKKYDLIVFDVLNNDAQPSYVFTTESLTELKNILTDDGMAIIEFQEEEKTKGYYVYQSICNTLLALGYKTYLDDDSNGGDIIIVASLKDIDISKYKIENFTPCCREKKWAAEFIGRPYRKCEKPFARGVVLYDDKPMIDVLNTELVKHWRINANSMYGDEMLKSNQRLFN